MEDVVFEHLDSTRVLAELRECDLADRRIQARRLHLAALWADLNPGIPDLPFMVDPMVDGELDMALTAIAEFAAVHGVSTQSGRCLIAEALELRGRLPRLWRAVHDLEVPAWKARLVAQASRPLNDSAAAWLDVQTSILGARLSARAVKKLALQAAARFDTEQLIDVEAKRWVKITADTHTVSGSSWVEGRLDSPDALDLEAALQTLTRQLAEAGSRDDLDHRRAHALGIMARTTLGKPEPAKQPTRSNQQADGPDRRHPEPGDRPNHVIPANAGISTPPARRAVQLYVHLAAGTTDADLAELGNTGQLVTAMAVRQWCATAGSVTIRPIIDLNSDRETRGYQPTDLIRQQIALRDRTCVFPYCSRPAHPIPVADEYSHEADHITPFDAGGPTSTDNLACLCRQHHRLKTLTRWQYRTIGPGDHVWRTPHGHLFLRTTTGTVHVLLKDERRPQPAA